MIPTADDFEISEIQIVVLMGGLGTRLGELSKNTPKALIDVNGRAFFDYQIKILKSWGFKKFLFLVGHHASVLEQYYGNGDSQDISISYSYDGKELLGTGGALKKAKSLLEDCFMLMYGDSFMDIDYYQVVYEFLNSATCGFDSLMVIFKNNNKLDKSNVIFNPTNSEMFYDKHLNLPEMNYIDYGVSMMKKEVVLNYTTEDRFDLSDMFTWLCKRKTLRPLRVTKRFYEVGNIASLEEFRKYANKRFDTPQKAVFLDRDGVLNKIVYNEDTEQLDSPLCIEEFEYIDGVEKALRAIQEKGYLIFIVTNQPSAAKGKTTLSNLYNINNWMMQDLYEKDIEIESVNMCPHHPAGTKQTQHKSLIKKCKCRKPEADLIIRAGNTYNILWSKSYMIGDSYTDILAGKNANIKTVFIGSLKCDVCSRLNYNKPDLIVSSFMKFAEYLPE